MKSDSFFICISIIQPSVLWTIVIDTAALNNSRVSELSECNCFEMTLWAFPYRKVQIVGTEPRGASKFKMVKFGLEKEK
jgi:hypothetical protein